MTGEQLHGALFDFYFLKIIIIIFSFFSVLLKCLYLNPEILPFLPILSLTPLGWSEQMAVWYLAVWLIKQKDPFPYAFKANQAHNCTSAQLAEAHTVKPSEKETWQEASLKTSLIIDNCPTDQWISAYDPQTPGSYPFF